MKYFNAEAVFPKELVDQMLHFVPGGLVYLSPAYRPRKRWGESSGERKRIDDRNEKIRRMYREHAVSIENIATEFHLSVDSIKRIAYRS